jgi:hypothetical protein
VASFSLVLGRLPRGGLDKLDVVCTEVGQRREVNDHQKNGGAPCEGPTTARPDCRLRRSAVVRSPEFVSFILALGGVVPPGASRDYFVGRQNLAGLEIGQSLDPTVPRAEINPGEFE